MESNHKKIQNHRKKYNLTYLLFVLAEVITVALAIILNQPIILVALIVLFFIHSLKRVVDISEMDILTNEDLFDNLNDRHP